MRNGMCRRMLQSGAALKAIVRSSEGKLQEVSEGVQFEIVSKCRHFVSLVITL